MEVGWRQCGRHSTAHAAAGASYRRSKTSSGSEAAPRPARRLLGRSGCGLAGERLAASGRAQQARLPRTRLLRVSAASEDYRTKRPEDTRVVVAGSTGYIGRFVVQELMKRGYNVVAFAREKSGIKGKTSKEDVIKAFPDADVRFGDVTDLESLKSTAFRDPVDVVVSCLASRAGGKKDSWLIDYQASLNCLEAARAQGAQHYVLLSAICVQKPLLEFQRAKLAMEKALKDSNDVTYSIVRPTAFFKSLAGQVGLIKDGKPYVMFGDGYLASCKPISESDLASFIADCVSDEDKVNKILPIGGPGRAYSAKEQAQMQFELAGKEPKYIQVPVALMDGIIGILDFLAKFFPKNFEDAAEFARIGKYYATESMLVWDDDKQQYMADETPSYGKDTLKDFYSKAIKEGLEGQELGDQAVFS